MRDRNDYILMASLFLVFLCLYSFFANGHYGGDALSNYLVTKSIIERGSISISKDMLHIEELRPVEVGAVGRDGRLYSPFGLGMPLLHIPLYLIGLMVGRLIRQVPLDYITFFTVSFTNTITSSLNVLLIYLISQQLGRSVKRSAAIAVIYGLSTMAIVYSKIGFTEPAMVMFMLAGFYLLLLNYTNPSALKVVMAGACCGYMFFVRIYSVIMIPCFLLYLFIKSRRRLRDVALFLICPLFLLIAVLLLNYYQFQDAGLSGYGPIAEKLRYGKRALKALYYYFLSTGKGLFFYNPVLLFTVFCLPRFIRSRRPEAIFIISVVLINILFFTNMFIRGSIFSWGPRYIFVLVPLMALLLVEAFDAVWKRVTVLLLSVAGAMVQLPALFINFSRYIYFVKERLRLDEYMINFIPDLSPIKGTWMLFISSITHAIKGGSLTFTFNPDPRLLMPIEANLEGYDFLDLWFINIIRFYGDYTLLVQIAVLLLVVIFISSLISFMVKIKSSST